MLGQDIGDAAPDEGRARKRDPVQAGRIRAAHDEQIVEKHNV